mmetsp:Transcript_15488/g.31779  ORF Transcript_15488/g.31779 Transcript_15488/m.31779 type:complete len:265 (+) Transcript_15488:402-1196(+)|eukprot:CAMPEP_0201119680 /NCGR_PEP_ID=MMETSP0850-20130426/3801_1 /ASSEMBLY_ACC=CAM_ASM_000622 /TAXON_ID=183588 /ORGANISM="Pseudo-nitzschia fraudulenta, Strain WWA7" /LENGTH=264 /DNA_ID=CAMNT_0047385495 /DNA_START=54 /DNA_END=848 /DNA_ORIENTATION=+
MSTIVGNPIVKQTFVDTWSNYYMASGNGLPKDLVVTSFSLYAKRAGKVQLLIYRRDGSAFSVVGKSEIVAATLGMNKFHLSDPIEAKEGDLIGWYVPDQGVVALSKKSGSWQVDGLDNGTMFTSIGSSATAFKYSSDRIYSIGIEGEDPVKKEARILISDIHYNGVEKRSEGDEFIEISNTGATAGDISGYRVNCGDEGQDFTFPEETVLQPGGTYRVYTNRTDLSTGGFSFGSKKSLWNNKGDVGHLYDASGNEIDNYGYFCL